MGAGGREGRESRHTVFFTPLNPCGDEIEESFHGDLTKPRKVHYKTGWEHSQDAVCWTHLGRAQEKGIAFWHTKLHAIIAHSTVPPDCIKRVISQLEEMTIYQRSSTPRSAPRIVLKNTWHEQQQQQQGDLRSCGKLQRTQCCKRRRLVSSRSPRRHIQR